MLSPSSHFVGSQDSFSGSVHTGAGTLGAMNRSKYALTYVNANLKILIEVGESIRYYF